MTNQKPTFSFSEDWTVVVFGFLIIGLYLLGFKIQPPSFGWSDTADLFGKVLTIKNLTNIFALFLLVYGIAILASAVLGKGISSVAKGFPIIYILTVVALILAGNTF